MVPGRPSWQKKPEPPPKPPLHPKVRASIAIARRLMLRNLRLQERQFNAATRKRRQSKLHADLRADLGRMKAILREMEAEDDARPSDRP